MQKQPLMLVCVSAFCILVMVFVMQKAKMVNKDDKSKELEKAQDQATIEELAGVQVAQKNDSLYTVVKLPSTATQEFAFYETHYDFVEDKWVRTNIFDCPGKNTATDEALENLKQHLATVPTRNIGKEVGAIAGYAQTAGGILTPLQRQLIQHGRDITIARVVEHDEYDYVITENGQIFTQSNMLEYSKPKTGNMISYRRRAQPKNNEIGYGKQTQISPPTLIMRCAKQVPEYVRTEAVVRQI